MSETGGGARGDEGISNAIDDFDLTVDPEVQEANLQSVSFDWCETVTRVGEEYWKTDDEVDLIELSTEIGLPAEEVRRAARTYYCIYDIPTEDLEGIAGGAFDAMIRYFRDHDSIEEIVADRDSDPADVRRWVREYLGGIERSGSVHDVDLGDIEELPSPPRTLAERLQGMPTTSWGKEEFQGARQKVEELREAQKGLDQLQKTARLTDWKGIAETIQMFTPPDHLMTSSVAQDVSPPPVVEQMMGDSLGVGSTMSSLMSDVVDDPVINSFVKEASSIGTSPYPLYPGLDSSAFKTVRTLSALDLSQYEPMFKSLQTGAKVAQNLVQFTEDLEQIGYLVNTGVVSAAGVSTTGTASSQTSPTQPDPTVDPEPTTNPFIDLLFSLRRSNPGAFDPVVPQQPEPKIDRELFEDIADYCTRNKKTRLKTTFGASGAIALILMLQSGAPVSLSAYSGKFADAFAVISFYMFVYRDD